MGRYYAAGMASIVITAIGDDRAGLVEALSGAIAQHGGNWDRSHMAELAGKFAGIVLVTIADDHAEALIADLDAIEARDLLDITAERADVDASAGNSQHVSLELVGQDHPGIVHEISAVLAGLGVSIDELETTVGPAPQEGNLFSALAVLEIPEGQTIDSVQAALEDVALDLMVDLSLTDTP